MNAQDAAPLFDKDNVTLGWVTLKRGSVNISGITTLQLDLTSHLSDMYLAAASATANVRACITTEAPSACPEASAFMYHKEVAADCSRRRATVEITVPPDILNCSYQTMEEYAVTFYVQVSADLAPEACSPASGTFYAGSQRSAISPGCSYITVRATCIPDTCEVPVADLAAVAAQAAEVEQDHKRNMVGVIVGVSVGTAVLVLSILAGIAYLHKRDREAAERRRLHSKHSDGSDGGEEFFTSTSVSSDDDYDLDFSAKSTTALGMGGTRGSILNMGRRASALFSRTPHSIFAAKQTLAPQADDSSVTFAGYIPAVVGAWAQHPGEELRLQGAKRFSDKYVDSSVQHSGYSRGAFSMGQDIMYGNPTFNSLQSFIVGSSGPSAVSNVQDTIAAAVYDTPPRAGAATPVWAPSPSPGRHPGIGAGGGHANGLPVSPTAKSSTSAAGPPPPPPVVPVTLSGRRSSALLLAELGFGPSVPSPRVAKAAAGGSGADLHDPEAVPEHFCAFINPLAVMGGRIDSVTSGTVRRPSALQPCKPTASPASGTTAGAAGTAAAAAAAASAFRRTASVATSISTSSLSSAPRLPSPPQKTRQRRPGQWADSDVEDEDELITSPARRRAGSVASLASAGGGGRVPPSQPGSATATATAAAAVPAPAGSAVPPAAPVASVPDERASAGVTTPTRNSGGPSNRPTHWDQMPDLSFRMMAEVGPISAEAAAAAPAAAHGEGPELEQRASRGSGGSIVLGQPASPSLPQSPRAWRGGGGKT